MDYAKIAIIVWVIVTVLLAIYCRKPFATMFGIAPKRLFRTALRPYLLLVAVLGAGISVGVVLVVKSIF